MKQLSQAYRSSSIKRDRRTKVDVNAIKDVIKSVLRADNPMSVRQVYYQLVTRGVIDKTEKEYRVACVRLLTDMRMKDEVPFEWIEDESRQVRDTQTFNNVAEAVAYTAKFYRRSALRECCDDYIEIWSEKEGLVGLIWDVASEYDVPVVPSKGMPSLTQVYKTACNIRDAADAGKDTFIYQFGDHDPSGVLIPGIIDRRLVELCAKFGCPTPKVQRIALTEKQIVKFRLPTRPTKRDGNAHARQFVGRSVELDALPAVELRKLVRKCIERHISPAQVKTLRAAEESDRKILQRWAKRFHSNQRSK